MPGAGEAHKDAGWTISIDVKACIESGDLHRFYTCAQWLRLRAEVLAEDKYECQFCKDKGIYTRATIVHHINHVRRHPELALSKYYIDDNGNRKRQLVSCCDKCHEEQHPERMRQNKKRAPITKEQW